jgi:hypothetical protein
MKLLEHFNQFLGDSVNLNQTRLDQLDSRVDSITEALKTAANLDGRVLDTVPQGSWAHRTIIRPATGLEFDADFLVELDEDVDWNDNPRKYANAVWTALSGHSTYGSMSARKNRCVRVSYANECHIDVVPYVIQANGRQVIVNREANDFEDTNPVGFTEWIQEKDDLTNGNLRKVIRLLKYMRDYRSAFSVKSVLLTTLVGNVVETWRTYDPDYYKDVPTTLLHLVLDLNNWLQVNGTKPYIVDPSCPTTSLGHRWTDWQYLRFRDKIHDLRPMVERAYNARDVTSSVNAWQDLFGTAFPSSIAARAATASTGTAPVMEVAPGVERVPQERFIEEMFPTVDTHWVRIECDVTEKRPQNRAQRRALRTRNGRVPKWRNLMFRVVDANVPEPFTVYWKVRNRGTEAKAKGDLRGQIYADQGQRRRSERTAYVGHHYVECYIVKDGVCVARAHQPVIIT